MASKDLTLSKQGTACRRKYIALTVPQKLGVSRRLESGESHSVSMTARTIGFSSVLGYKEMKDQLPVRM